MKNRQEHIPRILIVDDEKIFRSLMSRSLADEGFDVTEAGGGTEALDAAQQRSFDIALLDVRMDGIDGLDVLRVLRQESPATECLILTGFSELDIALSALKSGAREFLTKPIGKEELVARVKSVWRAHNAETYLRELQERYSEKSLSNLLTPLGGMKSALNYLSGAVSGSLSEQQRNILLTITKTVAQMEMTLSDMLDLRLYETGLVEIDRLPTNLDELVPAVCARFNSRSNAGKIKMAVDVAPNIPTVEVDQNKIELVIQRLLDRAIQQTPEGGNVDIRVSLDKSADAERSQNYIKVSITNSGEQIPKEELSLLFDKYKEIMIEKPMIVSQDNLRLPICKNIVEAHNGTVSADSRGTNGVTLSFRIPVST